MSYAHPSDVEALWGREALVALADRDGDDAPDPARLEQALADASAEIDGYVGVRHRLPLAAPPAQLRRPCCDIAVYRLATGAGAVSEDMRQRYDDAVRFLERVADGKAALDVIDPATEPDADGPRPIVTSGPARKFSRASLEEF